MNNLEDLDEYGRDSKGVYKNAYTGRRYRDLYESAAYLYEDAFDGDSETEWNID